MFCKVTSDLNKHIDEMDYQDERNEAIDALSSDIYNAISAGEYFESVYSDEEITIETFVEWAELDIEELNEANLLHDKLNEYSIEMAKELIGE